MLNTCRGEAELEVAEYSTKLLSSFREAVSALVSVVWIVTVSQYLQGRKCLQLGSLPEQAVSPSELCVTVLSAHIALMMSFNFPV